MTNWVSILALTGFSLFTRPCHAELSAAQGLQEIQAGMEHARPIWHREAMKNLPKVWGLDVGLDSEAYKSEMYLRYGLSYDDKFINKGLPIGLTQTIEPFKYGGAEQVGFTVSCQACHTSKLNNEVVNGVSNVFFDYNRLIQDLKKASGLSPKSFFQSNPDRNSMVSYSNYMGRLSIFIRPSFPAVDLDRLYAVFTDPNPKNSIVEPLQKEQGLRKPIKTQPWLGYKYKEAAGIGRYVDGGFYGTSSGTHYAIHFSLDDAFGLDFTKAVAKFDRKAPAFLKSLGAPDYPWITELSPDKVISGKNIYSKKCASCHGDYKVKTNGIKYALVNFPAKLVGRKKLNTDPMRIDYALNYDSEVPDYVLKTYVKTGKYIAPPLDGIWARAPYLHNGSVPNLEQLLNSKLRFESFGLHSPTPNLDNFDRRNVGWRTTDLSSHTSAELELLKASDPYIRIYDSSSQPGMKNTGHTFGDSFSKKERGDIIEFLKAI